MSGAASTKTPLWTQKQEKGIKRNQGWLPSGLEMFDKYFKEIKEARTTQVQKYDAYFAYKQRQEEETTGIKQKREAIVERERGFTSPCEDDMSVGDEANTNSGGNSSHITNSDSTAQNNMVSVEATITTNTNIGSQY